MSDTSVDKHIGVSQQDKDGGYYAVKGFLYQFDLTIMEILNNPDKDIQFENEQDIDYENFVIQVKHKETQNYSPNKVKAPIIQLLQLFEKENTKNFCLLCHFKDTNPVEYILTLEDLNGILGNKKDDYSTIIKTQFIKSFKIKFLHDYEKQFKELLLTIESIYHVEKDMTLYYHSIFRSEILRLVIKERRLRTLNKSQLDNLIKKYNDLVFFRLYGNYLSKESYEKFIRKVFFTQKGINLLNYERLFIIDMYQFWNITDVLTIISNISRKFYKKDKTSAPIICFRNLNTNNINLIKQEMIDMGFYFNDGTFFNGDKFRMDKLFNPIGREVYVRFIDEQNLVELVETKNIQEIFQFFIEESIELKTRYKHSKIQLKEVLQINQILN